jgi:hypothetical protein
MAIELLGFRFSAVADADLHTNQFGYVKFDADMGVIGCTAVTDIPCGVLQNTPTLGQPAEVLAMGLTKIAIGTTATAGQLLGVQVTNGQAKPIAAGSDTTQYITGQCCIGAAGGAIGSALINCLSMARAV